MSRGDGSRGQSTRSSRSRQGAKRTLLRFTGKKCDRCNTTISTRNSAVIHTVPLFMGGEEGKVDRNIPKQRPKNLEVVCLMCERAYSKRCEVMMAWKNGADIQVSYFPWREHIWYPFLDHHRWILGYDYRVKP